jgi:hypothetical protein
MRRPAGLALALTVALCGCIHVRPGTIGPPLGAPVAAGFEARASGDTGRLRFRGLLAAGPGGRLRVEISSGGDALLLVSGDTGLTAAFTRGGLYVDEPPGSELLSEISGLRIRASEVAAVITGEAAGSRAGECAASTGRWRDVAGAGSLPTRVRLDCSGGRLSLKLNEPRLLDADRADRAFAPLARPDGYTRVDAPGLARALREAFGARGDASPR